MASASQAHVIPFSQYTPDTADCDVSTDRRAAEELVSFIPELNISWGTIRSKSGLGSLNVLAWLKSRATPAHLSDGVANNAGLLLIVAAQAFFAFMSVAVKKLNSLDPPVPAFELIFVRMTITWMCCVAYMLIAKVPDPFLGPSGVRLLLAVRGSSGFCGIFGLYYSLQYLSVSDATVLTFLAPLSTGVAAALILKEQISYREGLAGLTSLLGVVLIARPKFLFGEHDGDASSGSESPIQRLIAVGVALFGVCGATGAYVSLRAIGKRAHTLHSLVAYSSVCVLVSPVCMFILGFPVVLPTQLEFLALLLLIGLSGFVAQVLLVLGLQRETAGRGSLGIYVQIVYVSILEQIFFPSPPSLLSILGTITIMSSAVYVVLTKSSREKRITRGTTSGLQDEEGEYEELLPQRLLPVVDSGACLEGRQDPEHHTELEGSIPTFVNMPGKTQGSHNA